MPVQLRYRPGMHTGRELMKNISFPIWNFNNKKGAKNKKRKQISEYIDSSGESLAKYER